MNKDWLNKVEPGKLAMLADMTKVNHQKLYVIAFSCVLAIFFISCSVKYSRMEAERVQTFLASYSNEFPSEQFFKFRPFIEQILIPAFQDDLNRPLKRQLRQTTCSSHLLDLLAHSKTFSKTCSDASFSLIQNDLVSLQRNLCSNVIIQSMSAGFPKLTIALLMLSPFSPEFFESVRAGFKWNREFRSDELIKFLSILRLSIVAPSLMRFSQFLYGHDGPEFNYNILSLDAINFEGLNLHSLVYPEYEKAPAIVELDPPRPVVDLSYNFEQSLYRAVAASGPEAEFYILKMNWFPGRYVLSIAHSMKLHGKDGKWYHLRGAFLQLDGDSALFLYDPKLRIWTLFKKNGKVQSVPSYFAVRFISMFATEMCYSRIN